MKFTIHDMEEPFIYFENKKEIRLNGYAFIDEFGKCIIIVFGESRRDILKKHFEGPTNELNLKYQYVDLHP